MHALVRFAEFITIGKSLLFQCTIRVLALTNNWTSAAEYPDLKVFCVHPGIVGTELTVSTSDMRLRTLHPLICI